MSAAARDVTIAPYGSWESPFPIELLTDGAVRLAEPRFDGDDLWWLEGRASEGGRQVLVRRRPDGSTEDMSPAGVNVRTRVHEYGGGSYIVDGGEAWFSNFVDGRWSRVEPDRGATPITPEGPFRYADAIVDRERGRLIAVREDHSGSPEGREAVNTLVEIPLDGSGEVRVLVSGADFYAAPRLSPDGERLAWLSWNHPNMPWDGMDLWTAEIRTGGSLEPARHVAGSASNWTTQPAWSPDGILHFVDERTGWLNLYRRVGKGDQTLVPTNAEFAWPEWVFASPSYGFDEDGRVIAVVRRRGHDELWSIAPDGREHRRIGLDVTELGAIRVSGQRAILSGSGPTRFNAILLVDLRDGSTTVLRSATDALLDPDAISAPESVEFETTDGRTAFGLHYPPRNPAYRAPDGELPPLIVTSHGGPTAAAFGGLSIHTQLFTSRGFAVLDVDYGGSTGYGRDYRKRLEGTWGVVDVDDCVNGALALADRGLVDRERLAIRGGSASGYTTLCAITFRDAFKAGVSAFGIGDLTTFVTETHKFESRYLDRLIGPYPARADLYHDRSPLNFTDQITCPALILQGLDDRVVPPSQARQIVDALAARGVPHAAIFFEGEDHGFRQAANIIRAFEAELSFYGQVFGFEPADAIEPIEIVAGR